jgi:hypothetical protein
MFCCSWKCICKFLSFGSKKSKIYQELKDQPMINYNQPTPSINISYNFFIHLDKLHNEAHNNPNNYLTNFKLAESLYKQDALRDAMKYYQKVLDLLPNEKSIISKTFYKNKCNTRIKSCKEQLEIFDKPKYDGIK